MCHGNICRSPMAEFVMKDLVKREGLSDQFLIASAATSTEEIGNGVHYGTKRKLDALGISTAGKTAVQLRKADYDQYDLLIGMEERNVINMKRIVGHDKDHKMHRLLDFTRRKGDIADPWYTGDFDTTYEDVYEGCSGFLKWLRAEGKIN